MKIKICKTVLSQTMGLMFSRRKNLLFILEEPMYMDLHMLFVFFPVDALYLDKNMKIMEIKHMKPFRLLYKAKTKASYVLELAELHKFRIGDKVVIKKNEIYKEKAC